MKIANTGLGVCLAAAFVFIFPASRANASSIVVQLRDGQSLVEIDPSTMAGIFSWSVNGVNLMPQQWFWFGTGDSPAEKSIDTLTLDPLSIRTSTLLGDPGPRMGSWKYTSTAGLDLGMTVLLTDGNPTRNLSVVLNWTNRGASPVTLRLFQYSHFVFGGAGSHVQLVNGNTARQTGSGYEAEISFTPFDYRSIGFEAALFPVTVNGLNDAATTSFTASNHDASGDVTAAFEWEQTLAAGNGSFILSMNENLTIPEPGSAVLAGGALAALLYARRRKLLRKR